MSVEICRCGHPRSEHGRHGEMVMGSPGDRREVCLECPGYTLIRNGIEDDGYPNGKAWHRFKLKQNPMDVQCPKCKAGPSQSCLTGAGNVMTPHNLRFKEALG